jgi:hypothetical protein
VEVGVKKGAGDGKRTVSDAWRAQNKVLFGI